jgi:hypothetical protein
MPPNMRFSRPPLGRSAEAQAVGPRQCSSYTLFAEVLMIHIIREPATPAQVQAMLQDLGAYIKLAVDIDREILAGGGTLHADCEAVLLEDGSQQESIWGADWLPETQQVTFESLINVRPRQNNRSTEIQDPDIRAQVAAIAQRLLGAR